MIRRFVNRFFFNIADLHHRWIFQAILRAQERHRRKTEKTTAKKVPLILHCIKDTGRKWRLEYTFTSLDERFFSRHFAAAIGVTRAPTTRGHFFRNLARSYAALRREDSRDRTIGTVEQRLFCPHHRSQPGFISARSFKFHPIHDDSTGGRDWPGDHLFVRRRVSQWKGRDHCQRPRKSNHAELRRVQRRGEVNRRCSQEPSSYEPHEHDLW